MQRDLIYDIGLHKGMDALWYLQKGFKVIGLEARKDLCEHAAQVCAEFGDKLKIVDRALYDRSGETVDFYVNPEKDDWGSLERGFAEKGVGEAHKITVETITLADLFGEFGVPYYVKCDIEGGDSIFAAQLVGLQEKPKFVSIEFTNFEDLINLRVAGYTKFQIVNQSQNYLVSAPEPAREGEYAPSTFTAETSGLFGMELDESRWHSFQEVWSAFEQWSELRAFQPDLALGWLDVHAT